MSDDGNVNGEVIDDADPNSVVVGVDIESGDGNEPGDVVEPTPDGPFDPSAHTVDEVTAYLAANPDDAERVVAEERLGKNRAGIVGS